MGNFSKIIRDYENIDHLKILIILIKILYKKQ